MVSRRHVMVVDMVLQGKELLEEGARAHLLVVTAPGIMTVGGHFHAHDDIPDR